MRFDVQCPVCTHVVRLPATAAGKDVRCLRCGARFFVPGDNDPDLHASPSTEIVEAELADQPQPWPPEWATDGAQRADDATAVDATDRLDAIDFVPVDSPVESGDLNDTFGLPTAIGATNDSAPTNPTPSASRIGPNAERPAFSMSTREFRELMQCTSMTRRFVAFFFWILLVFVALQLIAAAIAASSVSSASTPETYGQAIGALVGNLVAAMMYAFAAIMLYDHAEQLSVFRLTRAPRDLIRANMSGGNFWKWMSIATVSLLVVGIIAAVVLVFVIATTAKPTEKPPEPRWPPVMNPRTY